MEETRSEQLAQKVTPTVRAKLDEILKRMGHHDLVEGLVIGLIGAIIPIIVLWVLYERVIQFVLEHFSALSQWLTFVAPSKEFATLIPMSLLVGVGIGFIGSALSVRKHLHE